MNDQLQKNNLTQMFEHANIFIFKYHAFLIGRYSIQCHYDINSVVHY